MTKLTFNEEMIRIEIVRILHEIGIPAHLKGHKYLRSAIEKVFYDQEYLYNMTKTLYPLIARENHTTAARVERAIRHAIGITIKRNKPKIVEMFGEPVFYLKQRPTNAECIAVVAELLYLNKRIE